MPKLGDTKRSRAAGKNGRWGHREKCTVVNKVSRRDEWWRSRGEANALSGACFVLWPGSRYMYPNLPSRSSPLLGAWYGRYWGPPRCFVTIDAHRNISALSGRDVDVSAQTTPT
ncbi:uncharacterized protein BDCG_08304 [Blastomyces dermatitidis ER-3]|uniref:Uncharacterized protein n=1 Tax=Ajellomyces dermatitidis (strain ER-3 / ATCC MYA-2586) TaxID=559297 RepID=A0ABP2ENL2_AJEDR|nr:uncharacterized protein BDCG_08304 [Blastomyces dermatitidis ER-3]EEQ85035.1 hypothetical protein BDCG_08304 [Blastomyces dermatitidis ER-3]